MDKNSLSTPQFRGYDRNAGKRWRGDDVKQLRILARRGAPLRLISVKLGRPDGAIRAKARELGLTLVTGEPVVAPAPSRTLSRRPFPASTTRAGERQLELFSVA